MKTANTVKIRTCPSCGQTYTRPPSLSRVDNETLICPTCGIREALESIGVDAEEQNKIIDIINGYTKDM